MGIFIWIVIGLIAGWLAHVILGGRGGISATLPSVGAIVGGFLFEKLNLHVMPDFSGRSDHRHHRRDYLLGDLARDPKRVTLRRRRGSRQSTAMAVVLDLDSPRPRHPEKRIGLRH